MGRRIERALSGTFLVDSIVLSDRPHADETTVEKLRRATALADAIVAVGSGTINDLCKFVSAGSGKPYVVFGTAPSMNGYTSLNAAIAVHGHKKSLAAQAPLGAFFDRPSSGSNVIAGAARWLRAILQTTGRARSDRLTSRHHLAWITGDECHGFVPNLLSS